MGDRPAPCPRCKTPLDTIPNKGVNFLGCQQCFGLFVSEPNLASYVEKAATPESATAFKKLLAKALSVKHGTQGGSRACPLCTVHLERFGFGENPLVILDRCQKHGIWLDRTELKKVVRSSRASAHPTQALPEDEDDDDDGPHA